MEGDSHLEHERFMTEMGYVPPVNAMYYVALWFVKSHDYSCVKTFHWAVQSNGLCTM